MSPVLVAVVGLAAAGTVRIRAEVDPDLMTVRGTLDLAECACTLVDPLPLVPLPVDDRTRVRTFPGQDDPGELTWTAAPDTPGHVRFEARLPRRFGDLGRLPGRGLFGNGGWYPLPVDTRGHPLATRWDVEVVVPPDTVGVLNGQVGTGLVRWEGYADRAALVVLPHAQVTVVPVGGGELTFVEPATRGPRRRTLTAGLVDAGDWPLRSPPRLTIVEDLDLLHLAVAAPGMVYLSARTFRVSPGLLRYHAPAVRRAMVEASVPRGVGWERAFVGGALTRDLPLPDLRKALGPLAWNPLVDALLHDGTLPFYDAMFDEPFPASPGLFEVANPRLPATVAARQVDLLGGKGTAIALSRGLLEGRSLGDAAGRLEIPAAVVEGWSDPYPGAQDYAVRVHRGRVEVERRAADTASAEVVGVSVDGAAPVPWIAGPGAGRLVVEPARPARRARVDPAGDTRQTDLANDRWPVPWTFTFAGHFYGFSPTQGSFDLVGDVELRRKDDTRNTLLLEGAHHPQDLVGGGVGYARAFGALQDRQHRPHVVSLLLGASVLDPAFGPVDAGVLAVEARVGYRWDTRAGDSPLRGHRIAAELVGGLVPREDQQWARALVSATELVPLDARQVLAIRAGGGWASGHVAHRLLPLGGSEGVRGVPTSALLANERVTLNVEYRVALFRNLSVPLPLVWLTEVQVSPGLEAGAAWVGEGARGALAATFGVHTVTDAFGVRPVVAGATLAMPITAWRVEAQTLQVYVDFAQSF